MHPNGLALSGCFSMSRPATPALLPLPTPFVQTPAKSERKENAGWELPPRSIGVIYNKTIAEIIDRTPSTVAQSLRELEDIGLVEKKLIALHTPYHIYIKLPIVGNEP